MLNGPWGLKKVQPEQRGTGGQKVRAMLSRLLSLIKIEYATRSVGSPDWRTRMGIALKVQGTKPKDNERSVVVTTTGDGAFKPLMRLLIQGCIVILF